MDERDYIRDLKGTLALERVTTACARAFAEYQNCMAHDEEIVVPPNLPEEIHRRLDHGRDLALKRAHLIHDALADTLAHLPIRALPPEYQRFHPKYMTEIAPEVVDRFMRANGLER